MLVPAAGAIAKKILSRMESFTLSYPATARIIRRAHVGVVASGDLEILMQPTLENCAQVRVNTSLDGFGLLWRHILDRFFQRFDGLSDIEINDFGANPGTVLLRLQQAAEAAGRCP